MLYTFKRAPLKNENAMKFSNLRITFLMFAVLYSSALSAQEHQAVAVRVVKSGSGFTLERGGRPYFVKGAGGTSKMDLLKATGGNSIRTWSTAGADQVLDDAKRLGLTVTMGLDVARERHGFNYDDPVAVEKQLNRLRLEVQKYKDHPALLAWGIGNELNLDYTNPRVWNAVNDIARMIHKEDPSHPATTMLAGVNPKEIDHIKTRCPDLDFISVQVYGGLAAVPKQLAAAGWHSAYLVTEWGPTGHWECPKTPWNAPIEETSSQKAAVYRSRYEASVRSDKNCLGSYVFLWGQKQERTPTWYGLFTEAGEASEVVDVMQFEWTGKWPNNKAPNLASFTLSGKSAVEGIYLKPGMEYPLQLAVKDPNGDKLTARWELLPEATDLGQGGDKESRPQPITGLLETASLKKSSLKAPAKTGAYRVFVYVSDGHNKVATANIPFFVQ
jgi:hypothetical protein